MGSLRRSFSAHTRRLPTTSTSNNPHNIIVSSGLPSRSYCMSKTNNANLHLLYNITASLDLLLDIRGWRSNRRIPRVIHLYLKDRSNPAKYRSTTGITFSNWGVVSAMIIGRYFSFTLLSTITKHKPLQIQFYVYSIFHRYNSSGWATGYLDDHNCELLLAAGGGEGLVGVSYNCNYTIGLILC